jgi:hypothetical protein
MRKVIIVLIISLLFPVFTFAQEKASTESYLDQINRNFTYRGKPIHPKLIYEFSNWLSDSAPPMIKAVDLIASFDTNEYSFGTVEKRGDWYFYKDSKTCGDTTSYESFGYRWLGKARDNIHVLETGEGGGSGFFKDLIIIKFSKGEVLWKGEKRDQILMSIIGSSPIGDRYQGDIKIYPDRVVVPASSSPCSTRLADQGLELKF